MSNVSSMPAYAVLTVYTSRQVSLLSLMSDGAGQLLRKILEFNPEMKGAFLICPPLSKQQIKTSVTIRAEGDAHTSRETSSSRFPREPVHAFCAKWCTIGMLIAPLQSLKIGAHP
jgi:hypothetical protein